ncbi:MAG: PRC-barrel domain-containing protein [Candidatus Promineifilaceae bacterium]|nr:PRC-barrel domain-containing protein [Candidatus Promineifilaceae bacterium]
MRKAKDLTGRQIVSIDDGRILGRVREVYFDRALNHLAGLHVGYEGVIDRSAKVIPREGLHFIGVDVVLVKSSEVVQNEAESDAGNWTRRDKITGRDLVTAGGTKVAAVGDIILGNEGEVAGFTLGKSYIESPVAQSGAVSRDAVVHTPSADEKEPLVVDLEKAERESFSYE